MGAQWGVIEPLSPEEERHPNGPGRPWRPARDALNGILWILRTEARWQAVPDRQALLRPVARPWNDDQD